MEFKRYKTVDELLADMFPDDPEMIDRVNESYFQDAMSNQLFILRNKAGVSQKEMAARLNVSQSVISKMENKGEYLKFNDAIRYIAALGYAVDFTVLKRGRTVDYLASHFSRIKSVMDELQELAGDDPDISQGVRDAFVALSKSMLEDVLPKLEAKMSKKKKPLAFSTPSDAQGAAPSPDGNPKKPRRKREKQPA